MLEKQSSPPSLEGKTVDPIVVQVAALKGPRRGGDLLVRSGVREGGYQEGVESLEGLNPLPDGSLDKQEIYIFF